MSALTRMRQALRPLNLYRLDGTTMVDAELAAYAAGLELLKELLDRIDREAFVVTAEAEGLTLRESLCGGGKGETDLQSRREMLLYRGAVTANSCTREALQQALLACGLRCALEEQPEGVLLVQCLEQLRPFADEAEMTKAAMEFLPAHLEIRFDFSALPDSSS